MNPVLQSTAIIAGCTGTLGPQIQQQLTTEGFLVHGGSRSPGTSFRYTSEELKDSHYWYEKIRELAGTSSCLLLINAIGQAAAPPGSNLSDINVRPVTALTEGGKWFAQDFPHIKVVVVQISAIAARYIPADPYGASRAEADTAVLELGTSEPLLNFKTLVLQLPYVYVEPMEDLAEPGHFSIRGLQPWSMEQIAGLPIIPLADSGEQMIYPVSLSDVTSSVARAALIEESMIVEVKGGEGITQRELIEFYAEMAHRNVYFIPLPSGLLSAVLDEFPYGLLSGYAPRVMHALPIEPAREEEEPFDQLLGRRAQGIHEAHQGIIPENAVTLAAPPIRDHLAAHRGKLIKIAAATCGTLALVAGFIWQRQRD